MTSDVIGNIVEGEVINVTSFGAFIRISSGEEGLVHISEVANKFVTDINEFVSPGDKVQVKILNRNEKNKLELSIKQAKEKEKGETLFLHKRSKNNEFEDRLHSFLKNSEEKQIDIRRNIKNKQGITKRKR